MTYEEFQRRIGKSSMKINESAGLMKMNPASISNNRTRRVLWHLTVITVLQSETAERVINSRGTLASVDPTVQQSDEADEE